MTTRLTFGALRLMEAVAVEANPRMSAALVEVRAEVRLQLLEFVGRADLDEHLAGD